MMKQNYFKLAGAIVLCEAVGLTSSIFTISAIPTWYRTLEKPFFAPPNWLFGPVWTTLYALMGISLYLIWQKQSKQRSITKAQWIFYGQLTLNFFWSLIFFGLRSPLFGFIEICFLTATIIWTIEEFYKHSKWAAYLLLPYLLWVSFASLLNFAIYFLN